MILSTFRPSTNTACHRALRQAALSMMWKRFVYKCLFLLSGRIWRILTVNVDHISPLDGILLESAKRLDCFLVPRKEVAGFFCILNYVQIHTFDPRSHSYERNSFFDVCTQLS